MQFELPEARVVVGIPDRTSQYTRGQPSQETMDADESNTAKLKAQDPSMIPVEATGFGRIPRVDFFIYFVLSARFFKFLRRKKSQKNASQARCFEIGFVLGNFH